MSTATAEAPPISLDTEAPPILFTISAAEKVKEILAEEGNNNLKLRIYVSGGGCSGFQYGFAFDENVSESDTVISESGVSLLIDAMSLLYLQGAEVDYEDGLEGSRFIIKNPNASSTCGCGSSFSM